MDIWTWLETQTGIFLLVFARMSGVFSTAPVLGSRNVPVIARVGLALSLALILLPPVAAGQVTAPTALLAYVAAAAREFVAGLIIGYICSLVFFAVQAAGHLLDLQIGFGIVNVFDPQFGQQVPLIGNFYYLLALMVFLAINGHHLLLAGLYASFQVLPLLAPQFAGGPLLAVATQLAIGVFTIALKIAMPVLVALFLTDVALGVLNRTMPQMNIFMVGLPGKIFVGLFLIFLSLPMLVFFLEVSFHGLYRDIYAVLAALA